MHAWTRALLEHAAPPHTHHTLLHCRCLQRVVTHLMGNRERLKECIISPEEEKARERLRTEARMTGAALPVPEVVANVRGFFARLAPEGPQELVHYAPPTPSNSPPPSP
jgi:hypothetical protein